MIPTPLHALIAEFVRRYWVLGMECSLAEIHKLAWFLQRSMHCRVLHFEVDRYGPCASELLQLLFELEGSYFRSWRPFTSIGPFDQIWFIDQNRGALQDYLLLHCQESSPSLEKATRFIEGFESPFSLELLASVDWMVNRENVVPNLVEIRDSMACWPCVEGRARKAGLFDDRAIGIALERILQFAQPAQLRTKANL